VLLISSAESQEKASPEVLRDPEALRAFRDGRPEVLEEIYWTHVDLVANVVRNGTSRVGGAPADVRADLVQETFARAFSERARMAYDGLRPYRPYLLTICRNLLADWSRVRGREIPFDLVQDSLEAPYARDAEPFADPQTMAVVNAYVASLPAKLNEVYRERYEKGVSPVEAARALGLSRQSIRTAEQTLRKGLLRALRRAGLR
jgi:RNA polymerase sigma-70 factor (ECF subfamily)